MNNIKSLPTHVLSMEERTLGASRGADEEHVQDVAVLFGARPSGLVGGLTPVSTRPHEDAPRPVDGTVPNVYEAPRSHKLHARIGPQHLPHYYLLLLLDVLRDRQPDHKGIKRCSRAPYWAIINANGVDARLLPGCGKHTTGESRSQGRARLTACNLRYSSIAPWGAALVAEDSCSTFASSCCT